MTHICQVLTVRFLHCLMQGIEIKGSREDRILPVDGQDLYTTLDVNIQKYATQLAWGDYGKERGKTGKHNCNASG